MIVTTGSSGERAGSGAPAVKHPVYRNDDGRPQCRRGSALSDDAAGEAVTGVAGRLGLRDCS